MRRIRFRKWQISYDPEATRSAYAQVERGGPEECGCDTCRNYAVARQQAYPPEARAIFEQLGIDISKEAEVYHNCKLESGLHSYGGWFHFIGLIEEGDDSRKQTSEKTFTYDLEPIGDNFALGFTANAVLIPKPYGDRRVIQVEFRADVPWVLETRDAE